MEFYRIRRQVSSFLEYDNYGRFTLFSIAVFTAVFLLSQIQPPSNLPGRRVNASQPIQKQMKTVKVLAKPDDQQYQPPDTKFQKRIMGVPYDKACLSNGNCFYVTNMATGSELFRCMYMTGYEAQCESIKQLIIPPEYSNLTAEELLEQNTSSWQVTSNLNPGYIKELAAFAIALKALDFNSTYDLGKKALLIGLGGGSLDMYLAESRKQLDITVVELEKTVIALAEKWFGVHNTKNRKTVNADGLEFIKHSKTEGTKYDIIFLDACDDLCPATVFHTADAIESIQQTLTQKGALLVNVITYHSENITTEFKNLLVDHFATCLEVETHIFNMLVACVNYSLDGPDGDRQLARIGERYQVAMDQLQQAMMFYNRIVFV